MLTADAALRGAGARHLRRQPADRADASSPARSTAPARRSTLDDATVVVIDLDAGDAGRDAGARAADGADRRLAAGRRGHAELRRRGGAHAAADAGRRLPGEAGVAGRAGAHLRPRRQGAGRGAEATEARDLHVPARRRRRRRHHAGDPDRDAAAQQRPARQVVDLPGRPRFPARRLRRLSRPRAAPRSRARSSRGRSASTGSCWR